MGGDGGCRQLFDELGRHGEVLVAFGCRFVTWMKVVPVGVVGVQTDLVGMAGVESVPFPFLCMRTTINTVFLHCIRGVQYMDGPLDAHPKAADAAEELDHADALVLVLALVLALALALVLALRRFTTDTEDSSAIIIILFFVVTSIATANVCWCRRLAHLDFVAWKFCAAENFGNFGGLGAPFLEYGGYRPPKNGTCCAIVPARYARSLVEL